MTPLRIVLILVSLLGSPSAPPEEVKTRVAPLFADDDVLEVTITAPFAKIMRERSNEEDEPATLTYQDAEGSDVTLELGVRTRGRFRRQEHICPFAPLRLNFKKSAVKGTLFAKSDKLKLVTHCRDRSDRYAQSLLSEYMAYRIFNLVTDQSFRVRLLRVRYVDSEGKSKERSEHAFVIEHRDQLGKRLALQPNESEKTEVEFLQGQHTNLGSVFQYLIANTDFSPIRAAPGEPCCHNNMLFGDDPGNIIVIPYDFDMSGLVNAKHSSPNPRFKLRSVRQRLYRGRCVNNEHVEASTQAFIDRKADIYALLNDNPQFSKNTQKQTTRFLDDFFATIENPKKRQSKLIKQCL